MSTVPRSGIFILLCVLAVAGSGLTVAAIQDSQQATIQSSEDSTNYLQPSDITNRQYNEVSIDVASAVDASAQELRTEADIRQFNRKIRRNPGQQEQIANEHLEIIERRYQTLDDRQRTLFESYSNGEHSGVVLSQEIVRLRTAIETQTQFRKEVDRYANKSDQFLSGINSLELSLATRQPVTDRLEAAMLGSQGPTQVYAESADDALVLATISEDTYLRQATIRSERNLGGEDQFVDLWRDATERTDRLYPWTFDSNNIRGLDPFNLQQNNQIYAVRAEHAQGELTVYLDGATRSVFHENQRKPIDRLPLTRTVTNESGSATVTVELANQAGPMRVTVTNQTGAPVEAATVGINGSPVGQTDDAGRLWAVQPSGTFEINATTADGSTGSVRVGPAG